jgi:D-aminopeptidase
VREAQGQAYVPVIVVSGDAQQHLLESRASPKTSPTTSTNRWATVRWPRSSAATCSRSRSRARRVLYVEDSRVVAVATKRMLERQNMQVLHVLSVEDALRTCTAESLGWPRRRSTSCSPT